MAGLPPFVNQPLDLFGLTSTSAAPTPQLATPISNYQSAISYADPTRVIPVASPSPAYYGPNAAVSHNLSTYIYY